jgi:hypothetical protein
MRAFLAVIALLLMPSAQVPEGVKNLDFEGELDQKGRPTGWMGGTPGYAILVDPVVMHGGQLSVRIERRENEKTDKTAAPLTQWMPAKDWRGKRLRLTGWLRTRDITTGWAGLWVRTDSETATSLAFDNMQDRGPRGTTDWKQYAVVLDVAPQATDIYFGILLAGNGAVWADDLALEEVPKTGPTTALPKKEKP